MAANFLLFHTILNSLAPIWMQWLSGAPAGSSLMRTHKAGRPTADPITRKYLQGQLGPLCPSGVRFKLQGHGVETSLRLVDAV